MTEQVLRFSRTFDAPRQLVFSCMIEPEHLTHFWGPTGTSAPLDQITVDARPGGAFTTVMVNDADGNTYPTSARYLEVSSAGAAVLGRGPLRDDRHRHVHRPRRRPHAGRHRADERAGADDGPAAQAGFLTSLDRFAAHLARLTAAER